MYKFIEKKTIPVAVLFVAIFFGAVLSTIYLSRGTIVSQGILEYGLNNAIFAALFGGIGLSIVYLIALSFASSRLKVFGMVEAVDVIYAARFFLAIASIVTGLVKLVYFVSPFVHIWGEIFIDILILIPTFWMFKRYVFRLIPNQAKAYFVVSVYGNSIVSLIVLFKIVSLVQVLFF